MSELREPPYEMYAKIRAEELDAKAVVIAQLQCELATAKREVQVLVTAGITATERAEEEIVRRVVAEARAVAEQKRAHEDFLTQHDYIVQQQDQISQLTQERDRLVGVDLANRAFLEMVNEARQDRDIAIHELDLVIKHGNLESHGAPCYYCGKPINDVAADSGRWGIFLCHADEPGAVKWHHVDCISERLAGRDTISADRSALLEFIHGLSDKFKHSSHFPHPMVHRWEEMHAADALLVEMRLLKAKASSSEAALVNARQERDTQAAGAAALREALTKCRTQAWSAQLGNPIDLTVIGKVADDALASTTAGAELLERLGKAEQDNARLRTALAKLWKHTPKIDNGYCAVCRRGYRSFDEKGNVGDKCSDADCLSHVVEAALSTPGADATALEPAKRLAEG